MVGLRLGGRGRGRGALARTVIAGGGVVGLGLGMMLAGDGHDVLQLERDPEPPPDSVDDAWAGWQRRGVAQFRLGHLFLARWRTIVETELPGLLPAMEAAGALHRSWPDAGSVTRSPGSGAPGATSRLSDPTAGLCWSSSTPASTGSSGPPIG